VAASGDPEPRDDSCARRHHDSDLHGKLAVVTGGAKGIGKAIVELLAASGATARIWAASPAQVSGASREVVDITDSAVIVAALARRERELIARARGTDQS